MKPAIRYLSHLIIILFALGTHANPAQAQAVPPGIDRPGFSPFEHSVEMLAAYPADVNFLAALDELLVTICQVWGVGPADPVEDAPVSSSLPVLVLAGEFDAARSPTGARRAAETLANSTVVEFPGAGHSVVLAGACPLDVMERFLDDPNATPDASCVAEMDRPHFFDPIASPFPILSSTA